MIPISLIERFVVAIESIAVAQVRQATSCEWMAKSQHTSAENSARIAAAQEAHARLREEEMHGQEEAK